MANALTYQSEFTGQQMDERFTAVATLTAALEALTGVVAQKYVKPSDGIPSTDMTAAVQASLAKAESAVQSLADYYTKTEVDQLLAAINGMDYVDVATLPTASASTMGKIYLLGPDSSGYYAYYYTSYDGTSYSWVGPLGTTEISLSNYATKAELNQLDQKVIEKTIVPHIIQNEYVDKTNGSDVAYNGWDRTDWVNVSDVAKMEITQTIGGDYNCWYDINKNFISKFTLHVGANELDIPVNAVYFKVSNQRSSMTAATYKVTAYRANVLTEEVSAAISRLQLVCTEFVNKSTIGQSSHEPTGAANVYRTGPIPIFGAERIFNISPTNDSLWYYTSPVLASENFIERRYDSVVPAGAKYVVITFYLSGGIAPGPATFKVAYGEGSKTCLFIGSSTSTGNGYFWKGFLEDNYGLNYVRNITDGTGHDSETSDSDLWPADGGITVIPPVTENTYNYKKSIWYRCAEERMGIYQFDSISILGGTNDLLNDITLGTFEDTPYLDTTATRPETLTFAAAFKGCIEMLHRDFPTKPIYICTIFACTERGNEEDENGVTLSERMAMLQMQIADYYRTVENWKVFAVPFYWDMRNELTAKVKVLSKDGVHPNYAWARRMAAIFAETVPLKVLQNGTI